MLTIPDLKTEFTNTLNSLSRSRHPTRTFSDWLEITAATLHQIPYHAGDFPKDDAFLAMEATYLEAVRGYDRDELGKMADMMMMTLSAHKLEFGDFLGELAGENEWLNQHSGQFFTPYPVCLMMANINLGQAQNLLADKGMITLADPAVGGGAMLIASAQALYEQGIDPRSCVQFDAIDVSRNAFNMAYIQLTALDLQAMVRHGNTLSNEMWEHRPTPQLRYFNQELQRARAVEQMRQLITDPEAFMSRTASTQPAGADDEADPVQADAGAMGDEQQNLFKTRTFTGQDVDGGQQRQQRADIVLPADRQLGLFSNENDG